MSEQSDVSAGATDGLEEHSKKDLVERALAAGVPDVLSMSRSELIEALRGL